MTALAIAGSMRPSDWFASAAAFLIRIVAVTRSAGARRPLIGKFWTARAVCVPFEGEDRWYLTTLPRDRFSPCDVAELYRLRWEVELYFRTHACPDSAETAWK